MSETPAAAPLSRRLEEGAVALLLGSMVALPALEIAGRRLGVPSTIQLVQQLTLWVGLLGGALAARDGRNLSLSPLAERLRGRLKDAARGAAGLAGGLVALFLAVASASFVASLREDPTRILGLPPWAYAAVMPAAFALVAARELARGAASRAGRARLAGLAAGAASLLWLAGPGRTELVWPLLAALVAAAALGAPIFALLGGAALVLFRGSGDTIAAIPVETYRLVVSPTLPTLPLFTLAGYALAEGGASRRLVRVFRALFGWLPGGIAIAAAVACAFFTTFTGGSGVTILALGGLLYPALLEAGHRPRYALGLVTASGSLGLLFPPSLPVILYAIVANVAIESLFARALLPGLLLLAAVAATGLREGLASGAGRARFSGVEARAALWEAKWELLLPVLVLYGLLGGFATLVEAAAMTALYALVVETAVHRDLDLRRGVPRVLVRTAVVVGGVLLILAVAQGLTSFLVGAEVPARGAQWVQARIASREGFLLALNGFLLAVGCLMDIFSAIVVVVPILLPMAAAYGVDPVHLGVIFLANLELGFLTPPVGLNLFLASFRFDKPLVEVTRAALPFLFLLLVVVLLVTYVPGLATAGAAWLAR